MRKETAKGYGDPLRVPPERELNFKEVLVHYFHDCTISMIVLFPRFQYFLAQPSKWIGDVGGQLGGNWEGRVLDLLRGYCCPLRHYCPSFVREPNFKEVGFP